MTLLDNAAKPRLSIRAKPLGLEAFKAKIGLKEARQESQILVDEIGDRRGDQNSDRQLARCPADGATIGVGAHKVELADQAGGRAEPEPTCQNSTLCGMTFPVTALPAKHEHSESVALHDEKESDGRFADPNRNPPKPRTRRKLPPMSALPWPSPAARYELVHIEGPMAETFTDQFRPPAIALQHWALRCAYDLGSLFPDRWADAERFALRHSLSIANAFHRRIVRADVVEALAKLFADRPKSEPH